MKRKVIGLVLLCLLLSGCQKAAAPSCIWKETDAGKQYIGAEGRPVTGWQDIEEKRYYFSNEGILQTGWLEDGGKRYFLGDDGIPCTGWQKIEGETYYFYSDGHMALGKLTLEGEEYLLTEDGMHTGVYENHLYDQQGRLQKAEGMTHYKGRGYYIGENGCIHTGWLNLFGDEYYFHPNGEMAVGETWIGGEIYHFSPHGIRIVLVNPWTYIPSDYEWELSDWEGICYVATECYEPLRQMMEDCRAAGLKPALVSAYRTQENQEWLYENRIQRWMKQGYDREEATALAGKSVAIPGTSEHQLGLAVDIVDEKYQNLDGEQENTATQQWLMEHCWEYGFILRYPNDASEITGIIYEPWHYRYVGIDIAMEMKELGITLEEYLGAGEAVG